MPLTESVFTSNEDIDNIEIGDTTVDIVGYVTKVNKNFQSPGSSKFHKFVVNNGKGREVQIIPWNENTKLLRQVKEMGLIVYIDSAKASEIRNKVYNSGNVNFELFIKQNFTIEIYGTYKESEDRSVEEVLIIEAYEMINKKIKIEAVVKSEFKQYKSKDFDFTIGSVTDTVHKLELKANCDCSLINFKKGYSVIITGIMEHFPPGPPILRIDSVNDIVPVKRERISFKSAINGYKNKI